jgi:hypothetical protein
MVTIPEEEPVDANALSSEDLEDIYDFADNVFGLKNPPYCVGSTTASKPRGVSAEHLAKIWRIDHKVAAKTITTTQLLRRSDDPELSRNYTTNDRMIRYRRINQHFYMDTFFSMKKRGQLSRGFSCMQLFVTDKGFIHVIPMKSRSEVPLAMKQFAKEIGAPDAFVCDAAREQISADVRDFCHKIGSSLRVLEEGTLWANCADLYIGLLKEAVQKDICESGSPLVF